MATPRKIIEEVLGEDFMRSALAEFGLQHNPTKDQEEFLAKLGSNILKRVVIDVLANLPVKEHDTFERLLDEGDAKKLDLFLREHIDNAVELVHDAAVDEYEKTKTELAKIQQGVA